MGALTLDEHGLCIDYIILVIVFAVLLVTANSLRNYFAFFTLLGPCRFVLVKLRLLGWLCRLLAQLSKCTLLLDQTFFNVIVISHRISECQNFLAVILLLILLKLFLPCHGFVMSELVFVFLRREENVLEFVEHVSSHVFGHADLCVALCRLLGC